MTQFFTLLVALPQAWTSYTAPLRLRPAITRLFRRWPPRVPDWPSNIPSVSYLSGGLSPSAPKKMREAGRRRPTTRNPAGAGSPGCESEPSEIRERLRSSHHSRRRRGWIATTWPGLRRLSRLSRVIIFGLYYCNAGRSPTVPTAPCCSLGKPKWHHLFCDPVRAGADAGNRTCKLE